MDNRIPRMFLRGLVTRSLRFADVVDWASGARRSTPPEQLSPLVAELASANPKSESGCIHIINLVRRLADEWHPDFRNFGPLAEDIAREVLAERGRDLLAHRIGTHEFCSLVNKLEAALLDRRMSKGTIVEYPKWMGSLWNACDWIDEKYQPTLAEKPDLAEEVRKFLASQTATDEGDNG